MLIFLQKWKRLYQMSKIMILIISAVEGIQGHTETVWNILKKKEGADIYIYK